MESVLGETWFVTKDLKTSEGKVVNFGYNWQEVEPEYLKEVQKKYSDFFEIEVMSEEDTAPGCIQLHVKPSANGTISLETLKEIVENEGTDWMEVAESESGIVVSPESRNGEESLALEDM